VIKYIGSKKKLLPDILDAVKTLPDARSVFDVFSGTSRVGHALKAAGYQVFANDHNEYAHTLAKCYVEADRDAVERDVRRVLLHLQSLRPKPGYFTQTFCIDSRFFHPKNGARIDAMREEIDKLDLAPLVRHVVLVSLMEAADRVDSTCGLQMAYLKSWASRAHNDLELRIPNVLPRVRQGSCRAMCLDALEAASVVEADVAYLDPPYNQHKYLGNYHCWETLIRWDKPEYYGVACKRIDVKSRRSPFNSKRGCFDAMRSVVERLRSKYIVVSFNNEGYINRQEMEALLAARGHVATFVRDYKRYVGAQIGIYNPKGSKVGEISHLRNKEFIYVVTPEPISPGSTPFPARHFGGDSESTTLQDSRPTEPTSNGSEAPIRTTQAMVQGSAGADIEGVATYIKNRGVATNGEIRRALGMSGYYVRRAIAELAKGGRVRVTGVKRGTKYHWVTAVASTPSTSSEHESGVDDTPLPAPQSPQQVRGDKASKERSPQSQRVQGNVEERPTTKDRQLSMF